MVSFLDKPGMSSECHSILSLDDGVGSRGHHETTAVIYTWLEADR